MFFLKLRRKRRCLTTVFVAVLFTTLSWLSFKKVVIVYKCDPSKPSEVPAQVKQQSITMEEPVERLKSVDKFKYIDPGKAGSGTFNEEFHRLSLQLSRQGVICRNMSHFGGKFNNKRRRHNFDPDGLWYVCLDPEVGLTPGKCVVYSVGIFRDWSFDEDIANFGCRVYSFDPTINKPDHYHTPKIQFFKLGLADVDSAGTPGAPGKASWKTRTLATLIKELGHGNRQIDILKVDIETDEWKCLPQAMADGTLKKYVRQLDVEFHIARATSFQSSSGLRRNYGILKWLDRQGFKIAFRHKNTLCPNCYEMNYINTNLVNLPLN